MLSFMSSSKDVAKDDDTAAAVAEPEETTPLVASSGTRNNNSNGGATDNNNDDGDANDEEADQPTATENDNKKDSLSSSANRQVSFKSDMDGGVPSEHFDNEFAPTDSERIEYEEEQRRLSFWASEVHPTYTLNDHMDSMAYKVYTVFSLLSAFLAACMLILNCMSFSVLKNGDFFTDDVCRSFVILLDCLFILVELPGTSQYIPVLQNWAYRGFLYMLTASMSAQVAQSAIYHYGSIPGILQQLLVLIIECNAAAVFCCGATYFFMGIFCMKGLMDNLRGKYDELGFAGSNDDGAEEAVSVASGNSSMKKSGASLKTTATAAAAAKKLSKGTAVEV